jgi:hypothetical protein
MRGNLADLAKLGLASEPPLADWLRSLPRGTKWIFKRATSKGDPWDIDLDAATVAWHSQKEQKVEKARNRDEAIKQFSIERGFTQIANTEIVLSIKERKLLLDEEYSALRLGEKRGSLIRKLDVEVAAANLLSENRSSWEGFSAELSMKLGLNNEQIVIVDNMIAKRLNRFADKLESLGEDGDFRENSSPDLEDSRVYERV